MATRSTIARRIGDTIQSIYCHWDGYPAGVGATLTEHYMTDEKIDALMALGDLSAIGAEIGSKKDFNGDPLYNECLAYGRDRGDVETEAQNHTDVRDWLGTRRQADCEFGYLWNGSAWETYEL